MGWVETPPVSQSGHWGVSSASWECVQGRDTKSPGTLCMRAQGGLLGPRSPAAQCLALKLSSISNPALGDHRHSGDFLLNPLLTQTGNGPWTVRDHPRFYHNF